MDKIKKLKRTREWFRNNPDYAKNWRESNVEKSRSYGRKWREKNKEACKIRHYKYMQENPWLKSLYAARTRCRNKLAVNYIRYGAKGIVVTLTTAQVKLLWERDRASLMSKPSIDRKNNKGNYTFRNCQFIELSENSSKSNRERSKNGNPN